MLINVILVSHRMHLSVGFRKSTPPQNRQLPERQGLVDEDAAREARAAGCIVVMDRCIFAFFYANMGCGAFPVLK